MLSKRIVGITSALTVGLLGVNYGYKKGKQITPNQLMLNNRQEKNTKVHFYSGLTIELPKVFAKGRDDTFDQILEEARRRQNVDCKDGNRSNRRGEGQRKRKREKDEEQFDEGQRQHHRHRRRERGEEPCYEGQRQHHKYPRRERGEEPCYEGQRQHHKNPRRESDEEPCHEEQLQKNTYPRKYSRSMTDDEFRQFSFTKRALQLDVRDGYMRLKRKTGLSTQALDLERYKQLEYQDYMVIFDKTDNKPVFVYEYLTRNRVKMNERCPRKPNWYEHRIFDGNARDRVWSRKKVDGINYERGHMAAATNHLDDEMSNCLTYVYPNFAPQSEQLNKGVWKDLENYVQWLAETYDKVHVITGAGWEKEEKCSDETEKQRAEREKRNKKRYITSKTGKQEILIPSHFYKIIIIEDGNDFHLLSFLFPNKSGRLTLPVPDRGSENLYQLYLKEFLTDISSLERFIDLNLIPGSKYFKTVSPDCRGDFAQMFIQEEPAY